MLFLWNRVLRKLPRRSDVKRIILWLTAAALAFVLTACGGGDNLTVEQVTGTWVRTMSDGTDTITLNSDMTYHKVIKLTSYPPMETETDDTYSISGDTISINYSDYNTVSEYKVTFEGNTMIWDNGDSQTVYTKK